MQAVLERKNTINATSIYAMRYSGATLRQIADKIGRTKERVRQILIRNYGSTKHKLISTKQLCQLSGLSKNQIMRFYQDSIITPVKEWDTNTVHYSLWSPATVERIRVYLDIPKANQLCRICHHPIPINRHSYCSEQCYKESHKYKYRSTEARQRHRTSMRRYKEMHKQLAQASATGHKKMPTRCLPQDSERQIMTRIASGDGGNLGDISTLATPAVVGTLLEVK